MAFDGFIKLDGIDGESTDDKHRGWMEISECNMEIKMDDCLISAISMNAGVDFPSETIHLNYGKIQWTYTQQNRQGGMAMGNITAGWNRRKNCAV